jgi:hypothetical protein
VTVQNIIGDYRPLNLWKHKLAVLVMNGLLRLIPTSRRQLDNTEHHVEWSAGAALSTALKQRCKAEGVSVHALLLAALERALFLTLGDRLPKAIVNPIDLRRGRFPALKIDTVFFGGGNITLHTRPSPEVEFWTRARAIHEQIGKEVAQEIRALPARFYFLEELLPLASGQIRWIMRLGDALRYNSSRFGLSNLGNVATSGGDVPAAVKDMRLYIHSFSFRTFGLIPYTVNGVMRFYFSIDERCMSRSQADKLQHEFIAVLQHEGLYTSGHAAEPLDREFPALITRTHV